MPSNGTDNLNLQQSSPIIAFGQSTMSNLQSSPVLQSSAIICNLQCADTDSQPFGIVSINIAELWMFRMGT